jgi:hypothetical protein
LHAARVRPRSRAGLSGDGRRRRVQFCETAL